MAQRKVFCVFFLLISYLSYSQEKKADDAIVFYNKASDICKTKKLSSAFCKTLEYYRIRKFDSSYLYSNKALLLKNISVEEKDILNYIQGVSAMGTGLYKKAFLSMNTISKDFEFSHLKDSKLGQIYFELENFDDSISTYLQWISRNPPGVNEPELKQAYHNLGASYMFKKEYDNAEIYLTKYHDLADEDTLRTINAKTELANLYYVQYKDDKAIPLFKEAYDLAKVFHDIEFKQNTAKNMAVVEKNRKDYKKSIDYFLEYEKWKDSLWNRDNVIELAEKDKEYAVSLEKKEVQLQKEIVKSKTTQRNWLIAGVIFLGVFLSVLVYFYKERIKQNKLITTQKEQLRELNAVKDYLFSVVSHDIRSVIHHIKQNTVKTKQQIEKNRSNEVNESINDTLTLVNNASHLLNNILSWSLEEGDLVFFDVKEYSLKRLLEQVLFDYRDFAAQKNIQLHTQIKEDILVQADAESLKVVLRNLLDNALKYTAGDIYFKIRKINESQCVFSMKDSGTGLAPETVAFVNSRESGLTNKKIDRSKGLGLGLFLCKTLIHKNKGSLSVDTTPEGATFYITLNTIS